MPALTEQSLKSNAQVDLTMSTLDGSTDTFTFNSAKQQALLLFNTTASPVVITFIGADAPATHYCSGFDTKTVVAVSVTVPANGTTAKQLNPVGGILAGLSTIANGTGLTAALVNL